MIKQARRCASGPALAAVLALGGCAAPGGPAGPPANGAEAVAATADAATWFQRGNTAAVEGRLLDAQAAYYEALARDPAHARARYNLGLLHLRLGWEAVRRASDTLPPEANALDRTRRYLDCLRDTLTPGQAAVVACDTTDLENAP